MTEFSSEQVFEVPAGAKVIDYVAPGMNRVTDGALVRTRYEATSWLGLFSRGESPYTSFGQLQPNTLVVVSGGATYIVSVTEPEKWWTLPSPFYTFLHIANSAEVAIIGGPWSVVCIDSKGVRWTCEPDSDGIEFVEEANEKIYVRANLVGKGDELLAIDMKNGKIVSAGT